MERKTRWGWAALLAVGMWLAAWPGSAQIFPMENRAKPEKFDEKITGTDLRTDKEVTLADYAGYVVVIDVWATWCGPCVRELPDMVEFQKEYADKKFTYIGLSADDPNDVEGVRKFVEEKGINYPILMVTPSMIEVLSEAFGKPIRSIPTKIVLDRKGRIASVVVGSPMEDPEMRQEYETMLKKLIAEPIPKEVAVKPATR